jgi:capsular exopolysaccharide synthesis family protein
VDIDLRRPNLHRLFDLPNSNGFSNLSTGQIDLDQAIRKTSIDNLDLIVAGDIPPNPTELMDNPRLPALLDELRARYDVVMIDSAPVLGLADAVILASRIGTVVYVIESGANSPRAIQSSLSRLSASGGTVAGAVLVKFDPGRFGYGYGTEYGYNYDYGARKD